MDDGAPFSAMTKHLPDRVPKTGELNCPTPAENSRIESAKPCDGEGILIRRKWKKKIMSASKTEACDGNEGLLQRQSKVNLVVELRNSEGKLIRLPTTRTISKTDHNTIR